MFDYLYPRHIICVGLIFALLINTIGPIGTVQAQIDPLPYMPVPGAMVNLSPEYTPAYLKGIVIHPNEPLKFDFIIDKGDQFVRHPGSLGVDQTFRHPERSEGSLIEQQSKKKEYTKLVKYFLASLAIPDDDQWVNLSPYEKDRIIKDDFGKTEMGRDLLAQDYMLKQITASLIYPENNLGKEFWRKVYAQAQKQYGTSNIPVNTFNKVWILPDDALIYEKGNTAYVLKNHLRVMLEEDYLSLQKHSAIITQRQPGDMFMSELKRTCPQAGCEHLRVSGMRTQASKPSDVKASQGNNFSASRTTHALASKIVREIVLPELQREVNEGANFAPLRQIYSGMLLATWFKRTLKTSLLGQIYANKAKVKGVDQDPRTNEEIYHRYLQAYKKGVFNFIKEDVDRYTNETVPRKYFSGGMADFAQATKVLGRDPAQFIHVLDRAEISDIKNVLGSKAEIATVEMKERNIASVNQAMTASDTSLYILSTLMAIAGVIYRRRLGKSFSMARAQRDAVKQVIVDASASGNGSQEGPVVDLLRTWLRDLNRRMNSMSQQTSRDKEVYNQFTRIAMSIVRMIDEHPSEERTPKLRITEQRDFFPEVERAIMEFFIKHQRSIIMIDRGDRHIFFTFKESNDAVDSRNGGKENAAMTTGTHRAQMVHKNINKRPIGGIDLNSANLAMTIKRDGNGILILSQQDLAQMSRNMEGLDPVILSIRPASQTVLFADLIAHP